MTPKTDAVPQRDFIAQVAKLAEYTERYEDMAKFMKQLVELTDGSITLEERNLLSLAYKQVLTSLRNAHPSSCNIELTSGGPEKQTTTEYRVQVEKEVHDTCSEIIGLLDKHLVGKATDAEAKVFYLKMKADYYRYLAEVSACGSDEKEAVVENSRIAYQDALDIASQHLACINPIRLGLALNFSVFHFEIAHKPYEAIQLAKQSYEEASSQTAAMGEPAYKDSAVIVQLLHDNLELWTNAGDEPPMAEEIIKQEGAEKKEEEDKPAVKEEEESKPAAMDECAEPAMKEGGS